jgi:hypothetical protein
MSANLWLAETRARLLADIADHALQVAIIQSRSCGVAAERHHGVSGGDQAAGSGGRRAARTGAGGSSWRRDDHGRAAGVGRYPSAPCRRRTLRPDQAADGGLGGVARPGGGGDVAVIGRVTCGDDVGLSPRDPTVSTLTRSGADARTWDGRPVRRWWPAGGAPQPSYRHLR